MKKPKFETVTRDLIDYAVEHPAYDWNSVMPDQGFDWNVLIAEVVQLFQACPNKVA